MYKAIPISPDIYWVGVIEWNERCIHGFSMPYGSTNNAYLIVDGSITLVDTCTHGFEDQLLERIASVVDPASIDYIVSNHSEKDHAGGLARVLQAAPRAKVVTSDPKGLAILKRYLGEDQEFIPVKSGDTLSIGKRTLEFIHTPMVHWPDNMVTYSASDKVLFSNDAFGQFLATSERFDDEVDPCLLFSCAKKYFANIVMPFARQTAKALDALSGLSFSMIAPAHGLIWRSRISEILERYTQWCALEPTDSAVVAYSSMYGATAAMAEAMAEGFEESGVSVRLYDLDVSDISDIMTNVMDAKYVAVGSSTHNKTVLPHAGAFLTYLKGLAPKGRIGIAFGSYGWAPTGQKEIAAVLEEAGFSMPLEPLTCDWNDNPPNLESVVSTIKTMVSQS